MATIYKRGDSWVLQWREGGRGSRNHRKSLGQVTEAEAQAQLAALRGRLAGAAPAAGPDLTLWAEEYAQWHSQEYPDSYYRVEQILRVHLLPGLGDLPLMGITRAVVESYKQARIRAGALSAQLSRTIQTVGSTGMRAMTTCSRPCLQDCAENCRRWICFRLRPNDQAKGRPAR